MGQANKNAYIELDISKLGRANNNADRKYNTRELVMIYNNIDEDLDASGINKTDN